MKRFKAKGSFTVTGIGQSDQDDKGIHLPVSGEVRVAGIVRQAVVTITIPPELVGTLKERLARPHFQIPLFDTKLLELSIHKL
jgi:hypothetical protein